MWVETVRATGPDSWVLGLVGIQCGRFRRVTPAAADLPELEVLESAATYDEDGKLLLLGL